MPRTSCRPLAAVGLTAALLGYVGCSSSPTSTPAPAGAGKPRDVSAKTGGESLTQPKSAAAVGEREPFAGWPTPAAALLISGEQFGYLEPCGCTEGQLGGLLRRYELVERLTGPKKWPLVRVDLGSLVKDPAASLGGPEQTKIKFQTALKALAAMGYNALALSPEDLKVGVDEAVGQFLNLPGETLKVAAANVTAAGLESKVVPSVRAKAGAVRVGVTAVVDPERLKALKDPALDLLAVKPIDEALPAVLADLEKDTDTQVLLVQAAPEVARELARKYPAFDVVVATSTAPDPPREAEPFNGGKTLLVNVGQKGKYAGVVGVFDGPGRTYRYERVTLGPSLNGPAKAMKAIVEGEYRDTLKAQGVVLNFPRHDFVNAPPGARFVGARACQACHPNTYDHWAGTGHAKAYRSLVEDPKPNTVFDAECVTCHTTGFEYNTGWKSAEATPYLKGNQCENCHGPASKHVEQPDSKEFRAALHLTVESADKNRLCLHCHDEDNSPHFDFAKYYDEIDHAGLDEYNDPKVHQGRPAKDDK